MTTREKVLILLPLAGYLLYVLYLAFLSPRPFLLRWIDGCFGLFVAIVLGAAFGFWHLSRLSGRLVESAALADTPDANDPSRTLLRISAGVQSRF